MQTTDNLNLTTKKKFDLIINLSETDVEMTTNKFGNGYIVKNAIQTKREKFQAAGKECSNKKKKS